MFVQTKNHCTAIRFPVLRESRCRPVARFAARAIAPFWTGIFLMFVSLTVQGQECAATSELPTQERISCLDMQINSLETQLKVSGNAGDIDQEKITSEFEEGIHAGWYGPVHTVQKIDIDGPIATDMYWRNNTYLGKTNLLLSDYGRNQKSRCLGQRSEGFGAKRNGIICCTTGICS